MTDGLRALQSVPVWLPQTATWLYDEVRFLPPEIESHVVCELSRHLDQFPAPNLHCIATRPRLERLWDLGLRKLGVRRHLGFLTRVARHVGARLLHSHFGSTGWADKGAAERAGLCHVVTFYGLDVNHLPHVDPRWRGRYRELFRRVDRVLCEGEHMARSVAALGCAPEKIRVHHLGVDVDGIEFRPRVWDPQEPLRVLIASTFREKKGIPYALDALGRVRRDVELEITIIGDAENTSRGRSEKKKVLAALERNELAPYTRLLGFTPHAVLREEAARHHVFLSPSVTAEDGDTEGGAPVSLIEMGASGIPVVSTRHCDIPGVILDGVTGLLAEERDVEGLVARLRWLVEHRDAWPPMVTAARRHIEAEFDARKQGLRLAAIYRELAG